MKLRSSTQPKIEKKARLKFVLDHEQRIVFEEIAHAMTYPYRDVIRARTILMLGDGVRNVSTRLRQ
jgi:hypothetical protein